MMQPAALVPLRYIQLVHHAGIRAGWFHSALLRGPVIDAASRMPPVLGWMHGLQGSSTCPHGQAGQGLGFPRLATKQYDTGDSQAIPQPSTNPA